MTVALVLLLLLGLSLAAYGYRWSREISEAAKALAKEDSRREQPQATDVLSAVLQVKSTLPARPAERLVARLPMDPNSNVFTEALHSVRSLSDAVDLLSQQWQMTVRAAEPGVEAHRLMLAQVNAARVVQAEFQSYARRLAQEVLHHRSQLDLWEGEVSWAALDLEELLHDKDSETEKEKPPPPPEKEEEVAWQFLDRDGLLKKAWAEASEDWSVAR